MTQRIQTVSIKPAPMSLERAIAFYEALNDVGKAGFILTLQEEDQQRFLKEYEEHYNNLGKPKNARTKTA